MADVPCAILEGTATGLNSWIGSKFSSRVENVEPRHD